ncbi:MAG: methionine synthase [Phycisphaerales bacterium]
MPSRFLQALSNRVLVCDGAMGTMIHKCDCDLHRDYLDKENCTEILVQTRPDVIGGIHEEYLRAGADIVETDTFGASKLVFAEFDLVPQTYELNKRAAEVARAACDKHSTPDKPRFVAGSIGPGTKLLTLGHTTWDIMLDSYAEQARGLIDGGADVLLTETSQDILQVKCAVNACLLALKERGKTTDDVPIMCSVTIETTGTMLLGTEIAAAAEALRTYPILSLGLNCATGPQEMMEHIAWLGKNWGGTIGGRRGMPLGKRVSVMPNAGLPVLLDGKADYALKPAPFVEAMVRFIEHDGVSIVGGCCGTTPEHIKQLVSAVESLRKGKQQRVGTSLKTPVGDRGHQEVTPPGCSSLYSTAEFRQDNSFLIVGERTNTNGSRQFKNLLNAEDWDGLVSMAKELVREGSHVLDVCVDYVGRDGVRDMTEVITRYARQVSVPLMIDSTQIDVLEAGLKHAPGRCIINSMNLEDGEEKLAEICHLARTYGAAVIAGTIDEDPLEAMAKTAERKIAIAKRIADLAVNKYGLPACDLLFDPLVLPVTTGVEADRRLALETVEGIRRISTELPECGTCVGLSNVSFGLKPDCRVVLNSVFLHECREAGLTGAIVHFSKILPRKDISDEQWNGALDLIYDRRREGFDPLTAFITLFPDEGTSKSGAKKKQSLADLPLEERMQRHIIDGEKRDLGKSLDEALTKYPALEIVNDHLLAGMKVVGDLFGKGDMQLPFVLQSAEVMKAAVAHLQPHMPKSDSGGKAKMILATVQGDVHDIGKNLVDIILSNNGYDVVNLGIKQPINSILKAYHEHKADAIGLSGLLVKSVGVMRDNLEEMRTLGMNVPVILGGAALTRQYAEDDLRRVYPGVYYGRDAFEGLRFMDLLHAKSLATIEEEIATRNRQRSEAEAKFAPLRGQETSMQGRILEAVGTGGSSASSEPRAQARGQGAPQGTGAAGTLEVPSARAEGLERPKWTPSTEGATARSESIGTSGVRTLEPADIPAAPFWGSRVIDESSLNLDHIYGFINTIALFRGQWQFKKGNLSEDDYQAQVFDEIRPIFERLKTQCRDEKVLTPRVVYGYWPCNSDGDDLVVFDAVDQSKEIERFRFPRQRGGAGVGSGRSAVGKSVRLCISDFFLPLSSGRRDVLPLQCVTMGKTVSERAKKLFEGNQYAEYLYLHGIGVECAEALAEMWHKRVRQEMGIASDDSPRLRDLFIQKYRGSRYSFGYPACPDMSDQEKLFRLLRPERIGCELTENWQIDPEQSTSAIVVHHPQAKYFNV